MAIDSPKPERMFAPPVGSDVDPTLVIGPNLTVADWHTIIEALASQDGHRAQHLCTALRRSFQRADSQRVFIADLAEL